MGPASRRTAEASRGREMIDDESDILQLYYITILIFQ